MVDKNKQDGNNDREHVFIHHPEGEYVKIDKAEFTKENDPDHKHQYKPDYSDETEHYLAFTCVVEGCHTGKLFRKDDNLKKVLKNLATS